MLRCAVLVAFTAIASAGPIGGDVGTNTECASSCPYDSKFAWEPSKTYEYKYSGDIKTLIQGATEEHSSLHITADVHLEVLTRCEQVLKLSDVQLKDSNPKAYDNRSPVSMNGMFKRALEKNILRFGLKDGEIDSICPQDDEEVWVLNVKRGILSHLQNTMEDLDRTTKVTETDVSGSCPVMYKPLGSGRIEKSKDVLGCHGGHGYETIVKGVPYTTSSNMQSMPLLKSSFECEQTINDDKIISQVSCRESHVFRPFSKEESGATTHVVTSLRHIRVRNEITAQQELIRRRDSLSFDSTPDPHDMDVAMREANEILSTTCDTMRDDVRPEIPGLFGKLVKKMRYLDAQNLGNLRRHSTRMCSTAKKFFRDAILMLYSAPSLLFVHNMIQQNEMYSSEAEVWLTSLALIPKPTTQLLEQAKPLLSLSGPVAYKAYLAVSSLINSFCGINENCAQVTIVKQIIKIFEDKLNYNCNGDQTLIIMALKAIGNVGNAVSSVTMLERCMANNEVPIEVRVAAINAFRRMSCDVDRSALKTMYSNMDLDSELRINAYLQVMKCPSQDLISQIAHTLENEEINQVGSFVWTHLTNLMETSDPHKLDIAEILEKEELKKAFDLDARKFSRNIEWSMFSHLINSGATVESNLIFSEKSFVPRTASFNFTVNMFGRAINLFEVDGRLEGFDKLLEDLFGPKKEINKLIDTRHMSQDALNAHDESYNVRSDSRPSASYSLKFFGNEIRHDDFQAITMNKIKESMNFLNWLIALAQNHEFELTKSMMFLDSTMSIPTATGMPLKLGAEGTATLYLKGNGKLDIRRMMTWPSNIDIDGSLTPSGAVEIISEMGVDAHCAKTGLQMVSTLHSSSVIKGKLQLKDGKVFSFNLDMPNDKVEVINVQSKFLISYREEYREQLMLTDNVFTYNDCTDFYYTLGIEVCAAASIPRTNKADAPMIPFTGPIKASILINKMDTHTGYKLEAKFIQEKERGKITSDLVKFSVSTPESQIDRELLTQLSVNRAEMKINFKLKTPWKSVNFDGSVTNTAEQKGFSAVTTIDTNQVYSLVFGMPISDQKNGKEYLPSLQIAIAGMDPMKTNGKLYHNPGRKIEYELKMRNVFKEPARISGNVIMINNANKMRCQISNDIASSFFTSSLVANVDNTKGKSFSNIIQLEYAFADGKKENFVINNKLKDQSNNTLTTYAFDSQWTNTLYPGYNGDMDLGFTFGRNTLTVNLDTGFGRNTRVKINQSGNFNIKGPEKKADGFVKLELPRGKKYELTVKHSHSDDELNSVMNVKYEPNKEASFSTKLKRESSSPMKLSSEIKITYPGREFKILQTLEQKANSEYQHNMDFQYAQSKHIIMESVLKVRPRIELTTDLTIPSMRPIKFYGHLKPTLHDHQSKVELSYGSNKYGIESNWNHGGNVNAITSRVKLELMYPGRRIVSTAGISRNKSVINGDMSTKWDADNDQAQKVALNFKTNFAIEKPSIWVKFDFPPRQSIEFTANAKYELDNWMRSNSDLEGTISFKSTYTCYKNLTLLVKFDLSPDSVTAQSEASLNQQKLTAELTMRKNSDYTDSAVALTITTPFKTYKTMGLNANYAVKGKDMEATIKTSWDDKEIALAAKGETNWRRHLIDGTLKFISPYTLPVTVTAKHNDNGEVFNTDIETTWGRNKEMKLQQKLTLNPGVKISADIKFTSTFRGFEEITFNSNTEKRQSTYSTKHELRWSYRSIIKLDSRITITGRTYTTEGSLEYPSYKGTLFNKVAITDRANFRTETVIEYMPGQKIEVEVDMKSRPKIALVAKLNSPFHQEITLIVNHQGNLRNFESNAELIHSSNKFISVSASLVLGDRSAGTVILKTPFRNWRNIYLKFSHEGPWTDIKISSEFSWSPRHRVTGNMELRVTGRNLTGSVRITTPWQKVSRVSAEFEHDGALTDFSNTGTFELNDMKFIITNSFFKNTNNISVSTSMGTSFGLYLNISASCVKSRTAGQLTYNVESSMWIVLDEKEKSFSHFFAANPNIKFKKRQVYYHFPLFNSISYPVTQNVFNVGCTLTPRSWRDFNGEGFVEIGKKRYTSDVEFKWFGKTFKLTTNVQTPKEDYRLIIHHKDGRNGFDSTVVIDVDGSALTVNANFKNEGNKKEGGVTLRGLEFAAAFSYESSRRGLFISASAKAPSFRAYKNWDVEAKYRRQGNDISANVTVDTPIQGFDKFSGSVNYADTLTHFRAVITIETSIRQFNKISAEVTHQMKDNGFESSVKVETPFRNFETMSASAKHEGFPAPGEYYPNSIKSEYEVVTSIPGFKRWKAERSHNHDSSGIHSKLVITTPIENYNTFSAELKHNINDDGFKTEFTVGTYIPKFSVEVEHSNYDRNSTTSFKGSIDINIPFRYFNKLSGEIDIYHRIYLNRFQTTVTLRTPGEKVSFSVNHRGPFKDFTTTVNVGYGPNKNIKAELQFKITDESFYEGKLNLECQCLVVENFEIIAVHDRTGSGNLNVTYNGNKVIDMEYRYNYNKYGVSYKGGVSIHIVQDQRFKLDMDLKNKIERYSIEKGFNIAFELPRRIYHKLEFDYSSTPNRITNNIAVQWNKNVQSKATLNVDLFKTCGAGQRSVNGQVNISSPWFKSESTIKHVVVSRKYTTEVNIQSGRQIVLKNELTLGFPTFRNEFTMTHPNLIQDLKFTVEGTVKYNLIEGKFHSKIEEESVDFHAGFIGNRPGRLAIEVHLDHPTSRTDMDYVAEVINTPEEVTNNMEFKWLTLNQRKQNVYKLMGKFNKTCKELNIELTCPNREMKLIGRKDVTDDRDIQKWSLVGNSYFKGIKAEVSWNKPEKSLNASIELHGDKIVVSANRENVKNWKLDVYHMTRFGKVQDVEISVVASRDGTVSRRTYFRPNMIRTNYLNALNLGSNCYIDLLEVLIQDLYRKAQLINTRTIPAFKRSVNKVAGDQIQALNEAYIKMYRNNYFMIRTFAKQMSYMTEWAIRKVEPVMARAEQKASFYLRSMTTEYWVEKINRNINDFAQKISQLRENYEPIVQEAHENMDAILNKVKLGVYYIKTHPVMQKLKTIVERIESMDLLEPVQTIKVRILIKFNELKREYVIVVEVLIDIWSNVQRKQEIRKVQRMIKKAQDWVKWAWEHYKIEQNVQKMAHAVSEISVDALLNEVTYVLKNRLQYDRNRLKSWDPKSGNYEVDFCIPKDLFKDLELPKLYLKENLMKVISWIREHTTESGIDYLDIIYSYRPTGDYTEWVPPFQGHAVLAGNQHYLTFDKKFYEFAGECSYLLARDFIDKKFSVVVHYSSSNGVTKKSITVHDGEQIIYITDGKVILNYHVTELPRVLEHTTIRRMGSEIRIDSDRGVIVTCALHYDRCTLNVTGWYFGKTGGLLGTYDNEPATDFTTSDNRRTSNVDEFANSWTVGRRCRSTNVARQVAVNSGSRLHNLCAKYFLDNNSPLHACFRSVDPKPFMQACMNDMSRKLNTIEYEKDVCNSAAFFMDECKRHKVLLRMPPACITCKDPQGNEFSEGRTITLEDTKVPQAADIVFVIQHGECNQEVVPKIAEIIDDLDQALKAEGLDNNRFGIVGYGGKDSLNLPHSETVGGEIMGEASEAFAAVANFEKIEAGPEGNALMALRFAAKYPFRTGVSKTIILVACESCKEGKVRYHEIQQLFRDRGIRLHMLMDHDFTLKGSLSKGPNTAYLFGADKYGLFTMKHVKGELDSDTELYNQVKLPKDICVALSYENDGTTFNVRHLLDLRRVNQKKFIEVMVRVYAYRAQPTKYQKCVCIAGEDGVGVSVCKKSNPLYNLYRALFFP